MSLLLAFSWFFPIPGDDLQYADPAARARALVLMPLFAPLVGFLVYGAHVVLVRSVPLIPAGFEAAVLLLAYGLLTGLRPLRALAEALGNPNAKAAYLSTSLVTLVILAVLFLEREAMALFLASYKDLTLPVMALFLAWPVSGRWSSLLVTQTFASDESLAAAGKTAPDVAEVRPAAVVFMTSLLLLGLLLLLEPIYVLAILPTGLIGAVIAYLISRRDPELSRRVVADAAAGATELIYLFVAAGLTLRPNLGNLG
ncbi:MAG: hypothetical protein KDH09_13350 [Chrysiogenetes bacterium]|nr:hypothetical protein [Chrysiogenetes bacterium]